VVVGFELFSKFLRFVHCGVCGPHKAFPGLFQDGVAEPKAIDDIMTLGMNHPMGPLALADLIGLDVCLDILAVLHCDLGEDRYCPCALLRKMVLASRLGCKSKRGFYNYD
jgi:3-hydroxybutyryl-CoA dehydrogenase